MWPQSFPVVGRGKKDKQKASEAMRVYLVQGFVLFLLLSETKETRKTR